MDAERVIGIFIGLVLVVSLITATLITIGRQGEIEDLQDGNQRSEEPNKAIYIKTL